MEFIYLALSIVFFLCLYLGFREGLRLGQKVSKGEEIKPLKSPITALKEHKENKEQEKLNKEFEQEYQAMMNYDGDIPKGE